MNLERIVADLVEKLERRHYGKYRGTVVENQDPHKLGRLKVKAPSLLGPDVVTGWATPCVPYGGAADLGFLFVPDIGANVWVEFEEGDLEFPIWTGSYWSRPNSTTQIPKPNSTSDGTEQSDVQDPPTAKIIKTAKGHTLQMEDADGSESVLIVEGSKGHFISMDQNGIQISDATGNTIAMSSSGFTITAKTPFKIDASGQAITIIGSSIALQQG